MSRKRDIFKMIDRNCVNPVAADAIKDYINNLIKEGQNGREKRVERV